MFIKEVEVENGLLKIQEVACLLGCSVNTINHWYAFKRAKPNDEYAKLLPDFIQNGDRQCRYWKQDDIWKLIEFQKQIPKGRNGVLGVVTQKYKKKG